MTTSRTPPAVAGFAASAAGGRHDDVELRALRHDDSAAVRDVFAGLDPRSRERRFLGPKPRLTESDVRQLTAVDDHDHVAILASSTRDARPLGIARFIRDPDAPGTAEIAVEVVDSAQRRGIGQMLVDALVRRALEEGVQRLTAHVSLDNRAVLHMLRRNTAGLSLVGVAGGTAEYAVTLEGALC